MTSIDHIVIAARDLQAGAAFVEARLGVRPEQGGKHSMMGTHNLLLYLGGTSYLEVIAIDPAAAAPAHPRWFGLDDPRSRRRLAQCPQIVTWLAAVDDIAQAVDACSYDAGAALAMSRGGFDWQVTVRADGALAHGGLAPGLIQWPPGRHPAGALQDQGCRLRALRLLADRPGELALALASVGADGLVEIAAAPVAAPDGLAAGSSARCHIEAVIESPKAVVTLT